MNELKHAGRRINHLPGKIRRLIPAFIWRFLVNVWTLVAMAIFAYEFLTTYPHERLNTELTIIYIGVLTLYVGTKEFRRWHDAHSSTRYGEIYVAIWTLMMITFFLLSFRDSELYVSHDLAATYIAVISIFAITRESKHLHERKK